MMDFGVQSPPTNEVSIEVPYVIKIPRYPIRTCRMDSESTNKVSIEVL